MTTSQPSSAASDGSNVPSPLLNRKAIFSIAFGLAAFVLSFLSGFAGFILGVPAVTAGIHARREIAAAKGTESGDLLAVAGITSGATTLALLLLTEILGVLFTT